MYVVDGNKLQIAIAKSEKLISEVQREAGLNSNTLYRLVNKGGNARLSTIGKVARVLKCDIADLVEEG